MKRLILFLIYFTSLHQVAAQCLSGDCKNGFGKTDLGYAIYEGNFKDGKPNGKGNINYGGDRYEGQFYNGSEHGKGILTRKNGTSENVEYNNGNLVRKKNPNYVGGTPIEGCIIGDCKNGSGEMQFPSGNRYAGEFQDGVIHGKGTFYFTSGNIFDGELRGNALYKGKFLYHSENIEFAGDFNPDGTPKTGLYTHFNNGATVSLQENLIIAVHNPAIEKQLESQEKNANAKQIKCPVCDGNGIVGSKSSYSYTTAGTYTMSQFGQGRINLTNPTTTTATGRTLYDICSRCKGVGKVTE